MLNKILLTAISAFIVVSNSGMAQTFSSQPVRVQLSNIPKPKAPAELQISDLQFIELGNDKNDILDAEESVEIKFKVTNNGMGEAFRLQTIIASGLVKGIEIEQIPVLTSLKPSESHWIAFKVNASIDVQNSDVNLILLLKEANGFDADTAHLNFKTQAFKTPNLVIADGIFTNNDYEGKISLGKLITLEVLLHNQGQGKAEDVTIEFKLPDKVFPSGESVIRYPVMHANQQERIRFEFFANKLYSANEILVKVLVKEGRNKFGTTSSLSVSLEKTLARTQMLQIAGKEVQKVEITEASLKSDIENNIPSIGKSYPNRYALIIGNEEYTKFQRDLQTESNVSFARNDARVVKEYFEKSFGIPSSNIDMRLDATVGEMVQVIDRLKRIIKNTNGQAEIFVYYAGHGLPAENKEPYLIPVDVTGANVTTGVKLEDLYNALTEFPSKRVTVILDACFSGGARGEPLLAMRGVKITPNQQRIKGNLIVFAASSGDQPSLPLKAQQHGMFTYYFLKKLQQSQAILTYSEMANYLRDEVSLQSVLINNKEQNPQVLFSQDVESQWMNWRF